MADREISPPGHAPEVMIPEHPSAGRAQHVRLRLTPAAAREYGVWQKELPADIPDTYDGRPITWFNNFGLKARGSDRYSESVPAYTLIVDKVPKDAVLVAYEEQADPSLYVLDTVEVDGELHATLDRGDPTVGWAD